MCQIEPKSCSLNFYNIYTIYANSATAAPINFFRDPNKKHNRIRQKELLILVQKKIALGNQNFYEHNKNIFDFLKHQ